MQVQVGKGIDSLIFGMREDEVVKMIGEPDKIYSPYDNAKTYQYNKLSLELTFEDENDSLLGWIEIYNSNAVLFGQKLIGQTQKDVVAFLSEHLKDKIEEEDYGSFISMTYDENWLELQFKFNRLASFNIGVLYGDNDEPIWPN